MNTCLCGFEISDTNLRCNYCDEICCALCFDVCVDHQDMECCVCNKSNEYFMFKCKICKQYRCRNCRCKNHGKDLGSSDSMDE